MADRTAASGGVVLAGVALAAALLPWPSLGAVATGLALAALGAFGLRRHGRIDRTVGAPVAGLAGAGLVGAGMAALVASGGGSLAPGIAAGAGVLVAVAAYADWRAIARERLARMLVHVWGATAAGVAGLVGIVVWLVVLRGALSALAPDAGVSVETAVGTLAGGLGTATATALYLHVTDRDVGYLDVARPDRRGLAYVAVAVVVIPALNVGIEWLFRQVGLESATHGILQQARSTPEILLVLVPLSYLVIGPGEELLYRNVVQKSLYDAFSRPAAITVASAIFAGAHVFSYLEPGNLLATLNGLVVVFVLSLVLGVVYDRTRNVVAAALTHGTFNALVFALAYVDIAGV